MGASGAARLLAVLASGLCLVAAGFLLLSTYEDGDVARLAGWLAIFMLGVSMFVGPALWLLADVRERREPDTRPEAGEPPEAPPT